MPDPVVSMFNTSQFVTDLPKKSFSAQMLRLMPNGTAPLFGISSMLKEIRAMNFEHGYFSKTMLFPQATLTAAVTGGGDTTFTVDSTASFIPGMILRAQDTGENVIIDTVVSSTQITVTRGVGTVAAAAISNSTMLLQIGNASEEGSNRPTAMALKAAKITNLTQIFRNSWALTDTARAIENIAGDSNVAESKMDCAAFHSADIEKAIIFGQKSSGTRNGKPFRTMDGILSMVGNIAYYPPSTVSPNVNAAGATTNYTQLEAMLDPVFDQASDPKVANERVLFCGGHARKVINNIGRLSGSYQIVDGQTQFGLQFSTFKTTRGTFRMIEHPLFNSNVHWAKMAVALDLSNFSLAYLGDRKTKAEEYNTGSPEANGLDADGGSLTTETTVELRNIPANAVITDLTAAA